MSLVRGGIIGSFGGGASASQLARSDGLACFTQSFTSVTTTSFTHSLGSTDVIVEFQDAAGDLLVPDNWTAVNNNVLSVEFSTATTGRVVIIACIASGLAPVTGSVTSVEGLSGIIDLDCPDGSTTISTSGQVINICSIFTPASGALLESLQTGGAGGGVTQLNSISGIINLTSPDESVNVFVNGQSIELTTPTSGAPSGASYLLREYNDNGHLTDARVFSATSGIRLIDRGARSGSGLVATLDFDNEPSVNQVLSWNGSMLAWVNQTGGGGGETDTQTSINGLSGTLSLTSPDGTILIGDSSQTIELSGLFTQASGQLLQNISLPVDARFASGSITPDAHCIYDLGESARRWGEVYGCSGKFDRLLVGRDTFSATGITAEISGSLRISNTVPNGQARMRIVSADDANFSCFYLSFVNGDRFAFCATPEGEIQFLQRRPGDPFVQAMTIASGTQFVGVGPDATIPRCRLDVSGVICASGAEFILRPTVSSIEVATLADIFDAGQTSINGVSGVVTLDSPNSSIAVTEAGQIISLDAIFTWGSGQILEQKCRDILILSGLILPDGGQTSVNGISGAISLTSPDESININVNGQSVEITTPTSGAPSGVSYLLQDYNDNGHLTEARVLSATSGVRLDDQGARSGSGVVVTLDFDNEPTVGQAFTWNGQKGAWATVGGGGGLSKITRTFTVASGLEFVVEHALNTEDWTWSMWRTDGTPIEVVLPDNVYPSGVDHAVVVFTSTDSSPNGIDGKIVFVG